METLTIYLKNEAQTEAIKTVLKSLGIPFESSLESTHNPELIAVMQAGIEEKMHFKTKGIETQELWK